MKDTRLRPLCLAIAVALSSQAALSQQGTSGGGCFNDAVVECVMRVARSDNSPTQQRWVTVMVLWRKPAARTFDPDSVRLAYRRWQAERAMAALADHSTLGGGGMGYFAIASFSARKPNGGPDTVFVGGRAFQIPQRDSVLVVLVDRMLSATSTPRVEHAEYLDTRALTPYPMKQWIGADGVESSGAYEGEAWLRGLLRSSPVIRQYLARAP